MAKTVQLPVRCPTVAVSLCESGNHVLLILADEEGNQIGWCSLEADEAARLSDIVAHWGELALSKNPLATVEAQGSA